MEIIIDRNRCEGKAKCVEICPMGVLELAKPNLKQLSLHGRLKLRFHGGKQAFAARAEDCNLCLACVKACPEEAISIDKNS